MICPRCRGKGFTKHPYSLGEGKLMWKKVDCTTCNASGHLHANQLAWIRESVDLKELRLSLGFTVMEAARDAGVTVEMWNEAEHGRANPEPLMACLRAEGAT